MRNARTAAGLTAAHRRPPAIAAPRRRLLSGSAWFALLLGAISFEGIARKLLRDVPGVVFYFAKDVVLLAGLLAFGLRGPIVRSARHLMRGFLPFAPLAMLWTVLQLLNPELGRLEFGLLGLRFYWLWWIAPLVVAAALHQEEDRRRAMSVLGVCAVIVAAVAIAQFSLPASHPLNQYAPSPLEQDLAGVATTGRIRVTGTFSYITGFTDFVTIVPALLLSVGLASPSALQRKILLGATVLSAVALPMSGSRAPVVLGLGGLAAVAWSAGLLRTRQGRRVVAAGALAVAAAVTLGSEAVQGVGDRFTVDPDETLGRFVEGLQLFPPLAMAFVDYPALGLGTGTHQNAAVVLGAVPRYQVEIEPARILVELGAPGYLLMSALRIGLLVAFVRAARLLRRSGMRAEAGAAWALALLTLPANLFFNHVFQALYFAAAGVVLEAVVRARVAAAGGRGPCTPSS